MKKILFAAISAIAITGAFDAGAADLRPSVKAAPYAAPARCGHFGGFYIGGNAGWAYHSNDWTDRDAWVDNFGSDWALGTAKTTNDGFTGGGQVGYNWQRGCTVFGFEADVAWADLDSSKLYSPNGLANNTKLTIDTKLDWYATFRGRTGIVVDNVMLYVTGGFALASIKQSWTMNDTANGNAIESFSSDKNRWGGVLGVGAEWAWSDNWTIKTELLYLKFQEETTTVFSPAGAQNVTFDHNDQVFVARVGVNYRFGGSGPGY